MNKLLLLLLAVEILEALFFQDKYEITYERQIGEWIDNKTVIEPSGMVTFKHNRTTTAINVTVTYAIDLDESLMMSIDIFKFLSNEYRELPSMHFKFNYCKSIKDNDYGSDIILKCGNFTGCPIKKGTYLMCNVKTEPTKWPPLIPFGKYRAKLTGIYKSKPIYIYSIYFAVDYPVKWH